MKKNLVFTAKPTINSPELRKAISNAPRLISADWSVTFNPTQADPIFGGLPTVDVPDVSAILTSSIGYGPILENANLLFAILYHLDKPDGMDNVKFVADASQILLEMPDKRADDFVDVLSVISKVLPNKEFSSSAQFDASDFDAHIQRPPLDASIASFADSFILAPHGVVSEQRVSLIETAHKLLPPRTFAALVQTSTAEIDVKLNRGDKESHVRATSSPIVSEAAMLFDKSTAVSTSIPFKKFDFTVEFAAQLEDLYKGELRKGFTDHAASIKSLDPILLSSRDNLELSKFLTVDDVKKFVARTVTGATPTDEFKVEIDDLFGKEARKAPFLEELKFKVRNLISAQGESLSLQKVSIFDEKHPPLVEKGPIAAIELDEEQIKDVRKDPLTYLVDTKLGDLIRSKTFPIFIDKVQSVEDSSRTPNLQFTIRSVMYENSDFYLGSRKLGIYHPDYFTPGWTDDRYEEHIRIGAGDSPALYQEGTTAGPGPKEYEWYVPNASFSGYYRHVSAKVSITHSGGRRVNTHIRDMTPEDIAASTITEAYQNFPNTFRPAHGKTYIEQLLEGTFGETARNLASNWGQFDLGYEHIPTSIVAITEQFDSFARFPTMEPAIPTSIFTASFKGRPEAFANDETPDVLFASDLGIREEVDSTSVPYKKLMRTIDIHAVAAKLKDLIFIDGDTQVLKDKVTVTSTKGDFFIVKRPFPPIAFEVDRISGDDYLIEKILKKDLEEQIAKTKSINPIVSKIKESAYLRHFIVTDASSIKPKINPKGVLDIVEVDDPFDRVAEYFRDLPENNVQASSGPGSAFKPIYCPSYFLEAYVGEPGSHASF